MVLPNGKVEQPAAKGVSIMSERDRGSAPTLGWACPSPEHLKDVTHVTLSPEATEKLRLQWERLSHGPAHLGVYIMHRKPRWRLLLSLPWMWVGHYYIARRSDGILKSAKIATLLTRVAWGIRFHS
jgi:hypothetical protein